ncbi:TIGR02099 family protein [Gammaproteobacteria bacterium 2W06]|nr:TIGR02099 family protein [Gammaproteobacteria bacterium 2W06]
MGIAQQLHRWIRPQRQERLKAALLMTGVTLVVSAAVLLTGVRLLFAAAPSLTAPVVAVVSDRLGVPVEIGGLDASLRRLRPGLVLEDVRVGWADGGEPLSLDSLTLAIAPWRSLQAGSLQFHALSAEGMAVTLRQQASGDWRLAGLLPGATPVAPASFLQALRDLPVDRLLIRDSRLALVDQDNAARLGFESVALRWRRDPDGQWRFALDARQADERVQARMQIDAATASTARAVIDLEGLTGERIAPWLQRSSLQPDPAARVSGRLWVSLAETGAIRLTADLDAQSLGLFDGGIESLSLLARADWQDGRWTGQIQPQALTQADGPGPVPGPIAFARGTDGGWRLALSDTPLEPLAPLLRRRINAPVTLDGQARRATLVWRDASDWRLTADLVGVGVSGWPPGLAGRQADLQVEAGPQGGQVVVDQLQLQRIEPGGEALLRRPVQVAVTGGRLQWSRSGPEAWWLSLGDVRGRFDGAPVRLEGRLEQRAGQTPRVDVTARAGALEAAQVLEVLPVGIMDDRLVAWLDRAIAGGRMEAATLRWSGPVDGFPYRTGDGVFDLRARLADVEFRYQQDWPPLRGLAGELRFRNQGMRISAERGRIGSNDLQQAQARIDDLFEPQLQVSGDLRGPLSGMLAVMQQSPVLPASGRLDQLRWQGRGDLSLDLDFPFQGQPMALEGALRLDGAAVSVAEPAIRLEDIRGEVAFDRQGVTATGVRARLAGRPVVASAATVGEADQARIEVSADTRMAIADWPGTSALAGRAEGTAAWRIRWERPGFMATEGARPGERLSIRSSLEGVALDLPLGLAKAADSSTPLALEWRRGADAAWRFSYADRLRAVLGNDRAALHFGERPPSLPSTPSTQVSGALPVVDPARLAGTGQGAAPAGGLPMPLRMELTVAGLDVSRWRIGETVLTGEMRDGQGTWSVSGGADGRVEKAGPAAPWVLRLETLSARPRPTATSQDDAGDGAPSGLPGTDIDLSAGQLRVDGTPLGRLQLSRSRGDAGGEARLQLTGESIDLKARIDQVGEGARPNQLDFDLYTRDAGQVLGALGLVDAMNRGEGSVSGELAWQGGMLQPALPTLTGDLSIDLRNGSLPAVEPGAGRALGLFSLSVLPRRLGLDFSDVVGEGLSFDQLQGTWQVEAGRMRTDDLSLTGPSMDLSLRGETDLVRRRYDQRVTVTPQLSSALAFLGGLAGGPAAAALLFVTRGMLESGVERLTDFTYHIGGTWDEPEFDLIAPDLEDADDD